MQKQTFGKTIFKIVKKQTNTIPNVKYVYRNYTDKSKNNTYRQYKVLLNKPASKAMLERIKTDLTNANVPFINVFIKPAYSCSGGRYCKVSVTV